MESEVIVALVIGSLSFIGVVFNTIKTNKISAAQNENDLNKTRIIQLNKEREKIETIKDEISRLVLNVSDIDETNKELLFDRSIDLNLLSFQIALSNSHFFDQKVIKKIKDVSNELNFMIGKAKMGIPENREASIKLYSDANDIKEEFIDDVNRKLNRIEVRLDSLLY